jgi:predicted acyltransferase
MQSAVSSAVSARTAPVERDRAIDTFRGVLLAGMVLANYLGQFNTAPGWLRHAQPFAGLNLPDIGFPLFLFILGLVLPESLTRRLRRTGTLKTLLHFLRRYCLLIVFGIAGNLLLGQPIITNWSVLQSIGLAGLLALPFAFLAPWLRLASGLALIGIHQALLNLGYQQWLLINEKGGLAGIFGGFAWAGVILIASFVRTKGQPLYAPLFTGIGLSLAGLLLTLWLPLSKPLATPSYTLFTSGLASLGLTLFLLIDRRLGIKLKHFIILGVNPLFVYMLAGVLSTIGARLLPAPAPGLMIVLAGLIYLLTFTAARFLYLRNWLIKL